MRYTNDGYISTEVELPPPGARVEYRFKGRMDDPPGVATFDGRFVFDEPYHRHTSLGPHYGYWRYLDTPDEEKRDSGQRRAFTGRSVEELETLVEAYETELQLAAHLLEHQAEIMRERDDRIDSLMSHIRRLEERISGQRKALASKETEVKELKSRLADRAKTSQLEKEEGWISAEREIPKPYQHHDGVTDMFEVMKGGVIISDPSGSYISNVFARGGEDRWAWVQEKYATGAGNSVEIANTYWRPLWKESTPENLATLKNGRKYKDKEIVEIKEKDGTISKAFLFRDRTRWHIIGKNCPLVSGIKGECRNISTQGTYFKRLD